MKTIEKYLYSEMNPDDLSKYATDSVLQAMKNIANDSYNQAIQDVSNIVGLVDCGEIDYDKLHELIKE